MPLTLWLAWIAAVFVGVFGYEELPDTADAVTGSERQRRSTQGFRRSPRSLHPLGPGLGSFPPSLVGGAVGLRTNEMGSSAPT